MSVATMSSERRTPRPGSKNNRILMTIPPHVRLLVDGLGEDKVETYNELILEAICARFNITEESLKEVWKRHCQETMASGGETLYCWRGMRMDW